MRRRVTAAVAISSLVALAILSAACRMPSPAPIDRAGSVDTSTTLLPPPTPIRVPTETLVWQEPAFAKSRYRGRVFTHVATSEKVVALTFDDGPDGKTERIVDILAAYGAHATFFFRGRGISGREVLYAVYAGNEIGNHTVSHTDLTRESAAVMGREIDGVNDEILRITGHEPTWVRAKAGAVSARGLAVVTSRGQYYANWSVHARDTDWKLGSAQIAANVITHVRPGDIVLMHQTRPATVDALPTILARLKAMGYRFVTVSELASLGQPR